MANCCNGRGNWFLFVAFVALGSGWGIYMAFTNPAQANNSKGAEELQSKQGATAMQGNENTAIATFGAGCFWCVEAVFQELNGVISVESGYTGGDTKNPTYEQICSGRTGHAEVCRIAYDPETVSFQKLLEVFWQTHDPTTMNRQGADMGTQYRSAIFYHSPEQKQIAEELKQKLDESGAFKRPIVTEITAAGAYYKAEQKHQDFYSQNPRFGYCEAIIVPKLAKFRQVFASDLKKSASK